MCEYDRNKKGMIMGEAGMIEKKKKMVRQGAPYTEKVRSAE